MSLFGDLSYEPVVVGDVAAMDTETRARWGQIRLRSSAGPKRGPIAAEVFMARNRSRFRVVDKSGKTEYLSSLQFCKFILELRATGRFEFERGKPKRPAEPVLTVADSTVPVYTYSPKPATKLARRAGGRGRR